jgi:hypothetical protein
MVPMREPPCRAVWFSSLGTLPTCATGKFMKYILCLGAALGCVLHSAIAATFDSQTKVPLPPNADVSFGSAVALSGNTMVTGAPYEDGDVFAAGAAYVFVNTNGTWVQQARLVSPQPMEFEFFAGAVAISGDTIVIGSFGDPETQAGAAYVFVRSGETWSLAQELAPSDPELYQLFGYSVAVSADTIAVSAFSSASASTPYAGAVYVFGRNGGVWAEQQKITAAIPVAGELLGSSIALDGQWIVAGAPYADDFAGAVYVFERGGSAWTQKARLSAAVPFQGAAMGSSVAISGNTVIAGAPNEWINDLEDAGSAHVFAFDGAAWFSAKLVASDPLPDRCFGRSVAIHDDVAVVGADGERDMFDVFTTRGAYVFTRGNNGWVETQRLVPANASPNTRHYFGASVAMSGNRIAVGDRTGFPIDSAVYVFETAANTAPAATCAPGQTIECVLGTAPVSVSAQVSDADAEELTVVWSINGVPVHTESVSAESSRAGVTLNSPSASLAPGSYVFEVTVSDGKEIVRCESTVLLKADSQPPVISSISATPSTLANGGTPVTVQVTVAANDNCSAPTSGIINVIVTETSTSKKPEKPAKPEWQITGPLSVELAAQGGGGKKTRTYTLVIETTDGSGNVSSGSVNVTVQ